MKEFPPDIRYIRVVFAKLELFPYVYYVECMRECARGIDQKIAEAKKHLSLPPTR